MNYYEARQRADDKKWDWTCMNDGKVWATGACRDGCGHETKEDAERHEHERVWDLIRKGERRRLDTHFGYACPAKGCENKAFFESSGAPHLDAIACDYHLDHPEDWYRPTQIISSW